MWYEEREKFSPDQLGTPRNRHEEIHDEANSQVLYRNRVLAFAGDSELFRETFGMMYRITLCNAGWRRIS
mgnify:CR=1 FL=1